MVTKERLDELIKAYSEGKPLISDEEYDALLEEYVSANGEESRPFTRAKQSTAINDIVGSLMKCYGITTPMREGQKTYVQWKDSKKIPDDATIIVQPKFDGGSVAYDFEMNVHATRGDFDDGTSVDVTELFDSPRRKDYYNLINKEENYEAASMKFECIMPHDVYVSQYADKYDRPRDAMAAILHSRNAELAKKHLSLMDLRIMLKDGTHRVFLESLDTICLTTKANDYIGIENFIKEILDNGAMVFAKDHWYECDGVVVSVIDDYTGNILDEVAIKILNMVEETKLLNIEWQFGRTGRITPVAILEPVKFGNVTVTHATLSNPNRVVQLGLRYGDSCRIMYNIVPYFLTSKRDGGMPIEIPTNCPICGTPFDMSSLKVCQCPNPMCVGKLLGNVVGYCKDMRMKGVAEATINTLWEEGVIDSIDSLYKITADDIKNIKGFGETSANAIIKAIHDGSVNVPLDKWLGAMPFNNVNKRTWSTLINFIFQSPENFLDDLNKARNPEEMIMRFYPVPGIGELTLLKIFEGFRLYWDTIKFVSTQIEFASSNKSSVPKNGIKIGLSGPGTRDPKLTEYLESCGYEVMKYNNSCSILVIPYKDYTSDSVTKAMSKNKTIITVDEAYKLK